MLRKTLKSTQGAIDLASIMVGILVIGIIGGVIGATVFAVVPWAQDNAAKAQLDAVTTAQSAKAGLSDGKFSSSLGNLFDVNSSKTVLVSNENSCWGAFKQSSTGKYFYNSSKDSKATQVPASWPTAAPANYPSECSWPKSSTIFASDDYKLNSLLAQAAINRTNVTKYEAQALSLKAGQSFTFAAAWRMDTAYQTTLIGQESFFKFQQLGDETNVNVYSGWDSSLGWKESMRMDNSTQLGKTNYIIASSNGSVVIVSSKANTKTIQAPTDALSTVNIGGNTSNQEAIDGKGVIYNALAWDRALTDDEQKTLAKYLASRS